jgi:hypothetical protein
MCLVNRLRPLLLDLIGPMQSAFIRGRLITDNALIAFECLHAMDHGNSSCREYGALKLDLTKAYDHRGGGGVSRGCPIAVGLSSKMGAMYYGLCNHCAILGPL